MGVKHWSNPIFLAVGVIAGLLLSFLFNVQNLGQRVPQVEKHEDKYWLLLHRKSNIEYLYQGVAGDESNSKLIKKFEVKSGVPGQKPTPLPKLLGREYFLITQKFETRDNPETSPYFLMFDIEVEDAPPYGPTPYLECGGSQCNWELSGPFGLHGVNGDLTRLSADNPGSSGCVRHRDEDIIFLFHLLDPDRDEIRYYIEDI